MNPGSKAAEPESVIALKKWLGLRGGSFHPNATAVEVPSGTAIFASEDIPNDSTIVSCPFSAAITEASAQKCLSRLFDLGELLETKRCALEHYPYVKTLPSTDQLRTPLYFTPLELQCFEGTNLYGATIDRKKDLEREWDAIRLFVTASNPSWGSGFTWYDLTPSCTEPVVDHDTYTRERYLAAATYVSSRAFPSSVLSATPSLVPDDTTKLVLLPGVDSLNHGRAQPVSWVITRSGDQAASESDLAISIVLHNPTAAGQEILNNYGPKPNSSFILGYGFSIPNNPDDTIILKLGGRDGKKWEIGRQAAGAEGLWEEILQSFVQDPAEPPSYEDKLDASGALSEMVQAVLDRLPAQKDTRHAEMRPEVVSMLRDYLEGQSEILESLLEFTQRKEEEAIEQARAEGVEIVLED